MKGTSLTAITWILCSAACSTSSSGLFMWKPFTFLLVQKSISLPMLRVAKDAALHSARWKWLFSSGRWWIWFLPRCSFLLAFSVTLAYTPHLHLHPHSIKIFLSSFPIFFPWLLSDVLYSSSRIHCKWPSPPPPPPLLLSSLPHCLLVSHSVVPSSWAEGGHLAGPGAATQDMGHASAHRSCLVLQPVELPVFPSSAVRLLVSMVER